MNKKHYGVFEVCYDTYGGKQDLERKKLWIVKRAVEEPHSFFSEKAKKTYSSRSDNELKCCLITLRQQYINEDKYRRCHRFKTRYFIHETDAEGWFLPSKKEVEMMKQMLGDNKVS